MSGVVSVCGGRVWQLRLKKQRQEKEKKIERNKRIRVQREAAARAAKKLRQKDHRDRQVLARWRETKEPNKL
jgi:hypothetical protein